MSVPNPHARNTSGSTFSRRLGYYLAGVAFGLVLLGLIMSARQRAVQNQEAERAAELEQAGGGQTEAPATSHD